MSNEHTEPASARIRSLVPAAVMTLLALPILIGLGVWQMQRLAWKEALIATITDAIAHQPVALETPADAWKTLAERDYLPVTAEGRFRHDLEQHLFATEGADHGFHVYTPLETKGGNIVFVNRGFVPDTLKSPETRAAGQIAGDVPVVGLIRKPGVHGAFEPDADRVRNIWYWRDLAGMTSLLPPADQARTLPFFIDASAAPANPGGWPRGGVTRLDIPNRHLEYALTWFGLAATLVAVFAAFAWSRLKRPADGQP